jgi:hypothetical protein
MSGHSHEMTICSECELVISQCLCMSVTKHINYKICESCKSKAAGDKYWCLECKVFVKCQNHRCEQWSQVVTIPAQAVKALKESE